MIVTRAPLRLPLGGGGTDLPFYSSKYGGSLVTAAINKYIYIILKKRDFYDNYMIRYSKTENPSKASEIQHSGIRAVLEYLKIDEPLEITSVADVPAESGLGSSSAFLVALLKAIHTYKKEDVSSKKLAEEAAEIEMNMLKSPAGKQDEYASAYGGIIHLDIRKEGNVIVSPLNISYSTFEELENNTLLFNTKITHSAVEVISSQKKNAESDSEKMNQMHIIKDIGIQIKSALESGDTSTFGKWLNAHWETKKKFGESMTHPKIDLGYEIGMKNGATGGKLVGAGGGGFLLFYSDNNKRQIREQMSKEGFQELPFRFDFEGCKTVYHA